MYLFQKRLPTAVKKFTFLLVLALLLLMFPSNTYSAPYITVEMTDFHFDVGASGDLSPGDIIEYMVYIENSGSTNATEVTFSDVIDFNTTLLQFDVGTGPKTWLSTPLARNDSYSTQVDAPLVIATANGLLTNDDDPDDTGLSSLVVSTVQGTALNPSVTVATSNGELVHISNDGAFTYDPPVGFAGVDSFSYQVGDDEGQTDTATVFIVVSNSTRGAIRTGREKETLVPDAAGSVSTISVSLGTMNPGQQTYIMVRVLVEDSSFAICNQGLVEAANHADELSCDPWEVGCVTCTPVQCTSPSTPAPSLSISQIGTTAHLTWNQDPPSPDHDYWVWRSLSPYYDFMQLPSDDYRLKPPTSPYDDPGTVGNLDMNYYYQVRGVNSCDYTSEPSNLVGEFDFLISLSYLASDGWKPVYQPEGLAICSA
ncbi:MAG: hypothetical protein GY759_20600 [Chloroflexi bacterium]|nr:hypothetical protein [Chloroflexota bacterium]